MPDIVHVACKLPSGIRIGSVSVLGTAHEIGKGAAPKLVGGYRITMNVPKAEWDSWEARMRDNDLVRQKLVIADANLAALHRRARENVNVPSTRPITRPS